MKQSTNYRTLALTGELMVRKERAWKEMECCTLCAHQCRVNRSIGGTGACQTDDTLQISGYGPHFGEEEVLVGTKGSGTIFFTGCNLSCVFCQNWEISHLREGESITSQDLGEIMLDLEKRGCHNINLVSPSHYLPQILSALEIAAHKGLSVPLVYNCGGYESRIALELLDGVIDLYMPDVKFTDEKTAQSFIGAKDYPAAVKYGLKEMHRQVGDLEIDQNGLARRGLIIRHLVLPEGLAGTEYLVHFIAEEISKDTYLNLMDQYQPEFKAHRFPPLDRPLRTGEYKEAIRMARQAGLHRLA